ncbi:MAG: ATP-binding protein [Bacteroidales bacterium]|jgi:PAS domain S-box-containing protein|nr:ATP-binding protein [Bacteroidales bacterium]MDY0370444.1 ATP-binding protein [Bacteroidales bacterium]
MRISNSLTDNMDEAFYGLISYLHPIVAKISPLISGKNLALVIKDDAANHARMLLLSIPFDASDSIADTATTNSASQIPVSWLGATTPDQISPDKALKITNLHGLTYYFQILDEKCNPLVFHQTEQAALMGRLTEVKDLIHDWISISEKLFGLFFTDSPDVLIVADTTSRIISCNKAATAFFKKDFKQLIGSSFMELMKDFQYNDQAVQSLLEKIDAQTTPKQHIEVQCKDKEAMIKEFELTIWPVTNKSVLYKLKDITHQKGYIYDLQQAKAKAEENDRMKSAFLANMSHEIRTPLNAILGFTDLLLEAETEDEERNQYYELIRTSGNSLLALIEDIIDIAKIEAGYIKINYSETDINKMLDELLQLYTNKKIQYGKEHIDFQLKKSIPTGSVQLLTDPHRLKQILNNLLSNALKFTEQGSISFGYYFVDGNHLQLYVRDTGFGIPYEKTHLVFQRFGQVDPVASSNKEGTGLGLSITKQLVELLGGTIWFDSMPGKGSTFYFTIKTKHAATGFQGTYRPGSFLNVDWSAINILVVDDVEANFTFYKSLFKHTGALLFWARDGHEAIRHCQHHPSIDIVLMDLQMPYMTGYDTARQIKKFAPKLPIIAQTAFADTEGKEKALASGCDDFIVKPFSRQELVSLIKSKIQHKT